MHAAIQSFYHFLLKNKMEVYEWPLSHVHAKIALVDGTWLTIGSYNLDELSQYGNLELNVSVWDPKFCREVEDYFNNLLQNHCQRIDPQDWGNLNPIKTFLQWLAYVALRFLILMPIYLRRGFGFKGRLVT